MLLMSEIDFDALEPLYEQVARVLRERIADGTYVRRLPGENPLAKEFGVSRLTVHAALEILTREGLVKAARGRGTFVVAPETPSD